MLVWIIPKLFGAWCLECGVWNVVFIWDVVLGDWRPYLDGKVIHQVYLKHISRIEKAEAKRHTPSNRRPQNLGPFRLDNRSSSAVELTSDRADELGRQPGCRNWQSGFYFLLTRSTSFPIITPCRRV